MIIAGALMEQEKIAENTRRRYTYRQWLLISKYKGQDQNREYAAPQGCKHKIISARAEMGPKVNKDTRD